MGGVGGELPLAGEQVGDAGGAAVEHLGHPVQFGDAVAVFARPRVPGAQPVGDLRQVLEGQGQPARLHHGQAHGHRQGGDGQGHDEQQPGPYVLLDLILVAADPYVDPGVGLGVLGHQVTGRRGVADDGHPQGGSAFPDLDESARVLLLQLLGIERRLLDAGVLHLSHETLGFRPELLSRLIDDQAADDDAQGDPQQQDRDDRDDQGGGEQSAAHLLALEPEADPPDGRDVARLGRVVAELAA